MAQAVPQGSGMLLPGGREGWLVSLVSCSVSYLHWQHWMNKLLPSPAHGAAVREQKGWKLWPGAREQSQEDMELFPKCLHFSRVPGPPSALAAA